MTNTLTPNINRAYIINANSPVAKSIINPKPNPEKRRMVDEISAMFEEDQKRLHSKNAHSSRKVRVSRINSKKKHRTLRNN